MNNNTIQVTTTVLVGTIAGFAGLESTGDIMTAAAIGVSYLTVAAIISLAVSNYRSGPKAYFASPPVKSHFHVAVPATDSLRTPRAKVRLAA